MCAAIHRYVFFCLYSSIFANAISILFVKYNTNEDSIDLYAGATMLDLVFDWHKLTVEGNKVYLVVSIIALKY